MIVSLWEWHYCLHICLFLRRWIAWHGLNEGNSLCCHWWRCCRWMCSKTVFLLIKKSRERGSGDLSTIHPFICSLIVLGVFLKRRAPSNDIHFNFRNSNCVMQKFAIIVDAAVDVLHEIHRVEDGGTHTEWEIVILYERGTFTCDKHNFRKFIFHDIYVILIPQH